MTIDQNLTKKNKIDQIKSSIIDEFDETNDDMDAYINLKEFEVVTLNEVI